MRQSHVTTQSGDRLGGMRAEVVGVGTELLLGQIANTNAQKISSELAAIGVDVLWHSVVGDNLERIVSVLGQARERADAIVITGGLAEHAHDSLQVVAHDRVP